MKLSLISGLTVVSCSLSWFRMEISSEKLGIEQTKTVIFHGESFFGIVVNSYGS